MKSKKGIKNAFLIILQVILNQEFISQNSDKFQACLCLYVEIYF